MPLGEWHACLSVGHVLHLRTSIKSVNDDDERTCTRAYFDFIKNYMQNNADIKWENNAVPRTAFACRLSPAACHMPHAGCRILLAAWPHHLLYEHSLLMPPNAFPVPVPVPDTQMNVMGVADKVRCYQHNFITEVLLPRHGAL